MLCPILMSVTRCHNILYLQQNLSFRKLVLSPCFSCTTLGANVIWVHKKRKTFKKKHYTIEVNLNKEFREHTIKGVFMWHVLGEIKERTARNSKADIVKNARLVVRTLWVDHDCGVEYQYCKCLVQQFCADHYMCTWSSLCSCELGDLYAFTKLLAILSGGKATHFIF